MLNTISENYKKKKKKETLKYHQRSLLKQKLNIINEMYNYKKKCHHNQLK